jgi:hypothetical protein
VGESEVRIDIRYDNLAAVEMCKPGIGTSFIGLRVHRPQEADRRWPYGRLGGNPWAKFGYDWVIPEWAVTGPLSGALETILVRFQAFRDRPVDSGKEIRAETCPPCRNDSAGKA